MKKLKICVYAIAKNEEKFVKRWVDSMSEADEIIVLDTGSTDKTAELLEEFPNVRVFRRAVSPWRFDTARNLSLSFVPDDADICVCTDLDEVFASGWRSKLEKAYSPEIQQYSYRYTWSFNEDGSENTVFYIEKIHSRHNFEWRHPVHEVLAFIGDNGPNCAVAAGVQLNHYPDNNKSRGQYLPLLQLSVEEDPNDDRNMHYLGREYMFYGEYEKAVETLINHLNMKNATWKDERCASMRYIGKCLLALGKKDEAVSWYMRACAEAPYTREPWMDFALVCYDEKNYYAVIALAERAIKINEDVTTYISNASYSGALPYDILSLAYYFTGNSKKALSNVNKALEYDPKNDRLLKNREYFSGSLE